MPEPAALGPVGGDLQRQLQEQRIRLAGRGSRILPISSARSRGRAQAAAQGPCRRSGGWRSLPACWNFWNRRSFIDGRSRRRCRPPRSGSACAPCRRIFRRSGATSPLGVNLMALPIRLPSDLAQPLRVAHHGLVDLGRQVGEDQFFWAACSPQEARTARMAPPSGKATRWISAWLTPSRRRRGCRRPGSSRPVAEFDRLDLISSCWVGSLEIEARTWDMPSTPFRASSLVAHIGQELLVARLADLRRGPEPRPGSQRRGASWPRGRRSPAMRLKPSARRASSSAPRPSPWPARRPRPGGGRRRRGR